MRKPPIHKSFLNAFNGFFKMLTTERNFQIEFVAFLINLILIFYFNLNATETALILTVCFLVLVAEIFNTVIEKICDFIQPEFDLRIGFIKDISAAAVTLLAVLAMIAGFLVYWKYIF